MSAEKKPDAVESEVKTEVTQHKKSGKSKKKLFRKVNLLLWVSVILRIVFWFDCIRSIYFAG